MAIKMIDSTGLFNGDRFCDVSDEARLMWPHLWCVANAYGRFEINYEKVRAAAFGRWKKPPSEDEFNALIAEYYNAGLLFVYEGNGVPWGEWDTKTKFLPKYQTTEEKRTPAPDAQEREAWKLAYADRKKAKAFKISSLKKCGNFPQVPAKFPLVEVVGEVVGTVEVEGEIEDVCDVPEITFDDLDDLSEHEGESARAIPSTPKPAPIPINTPPANSVPAWRVSEDYAPMVEVSRRFWGDFVTDEMFAEGYRGYLSLGMELRFLVCQSIQNRIDVNENARFVRCPPGYFHGDYWKRAPRIDKVQPQLDRNERRRNETVALAELLMNFDAKQKVG